MRLPSLLRNKLLLLPCLILLATILTATPALSYSSLRDPSIGEYKRDVWEPAVYGTEEMNLESFTNESFLALLASIADFFGGPINDQYRASAPAGAVYGAAGLLAMMYAAPPVSGVEYLADLGSRVGLAAPAYAQGPGIGFEALAPVRPIWTAFRNVSYLLFVIIFVLIGLAVMFRVRLNPQTVIGIQNAIPRLVIALILVTFSYAIAGFIVDLIFVLTFLVMAFLRAGGLINPTGLGNDIVNAIILQGNVFTLAITIFLISIGNIASAVANLFGGAAGGIIVPFVPDVVIPGTNINILDDFINFAISRTIGTFIVAPIFSIIFFIILLISLFRLFWILLSSYLRIILAVIFAPFQLLLGALPAIEAFGFGSWIRGLFSNMIVFPATLAGFLLAHILMGPTVISLPGWGTICNVVGCDPCSPGVSLGNIFGLDCRVGYGASGSQVVPPLLGTYAGDVNLLKVLIGLGIMVMLPGALNAMKEAISKGPRMEFLSREQQAAAGRGMQFVGGGIVGEQGRLQQSLEKGRLARAGRVPGVKGVVGWGGRTLEVAGGVIGGRPPRPQEPRPGGKKS